eukprot:TRINITY_DN7032_c0_g1_i1.p1 TRINITY_DN7032_c0_g1~~TRINITY_DN7032_c0_g1_i1.p1  ORF type:complete len:176 (-),score=50.14 TRINITY_DN7032_c0_g1_i1:64-591(-)
MLYIVDKYDKDFKFTFQQGTPEYYELLSWVFFQMGGLGPMQGQANHFYRYAPEKIPYGINRYQNETRRLYGVLDKALGESKDGWLVGNKYTIADMINFSWVNMGFWAGIDTKEFPNLEKWVEKLEAREGVKRGLDVPEKFTKKEEWRKDPSSVDVHAKAASAWIMKGQEEDAKKK